MELGLENAASAATEVLRVVSENEKKFFFYGIPVSVLPHAAGIEISARGWTYSYRTYGMSRSTKPFATDPMGFEIIAKAKQFVKDLCDADKRAIAEPKPQAAHVAPALQGA